MIASPRLAAAVAVVVTAAAVGCGPDRPADGPPPPPPSAAAPVAPAPPPSAPPPAASSAAVAPPPPAAPKLPPPKPTTIPLRRGHEPADELVDKGDAAFEAGDAAEAARQYAAAKKLDPKHPGPHVGEVRLRLAKLDVPLDYASAKNKPELKPIVADLKKIAAA
ncbi:MAG: hypothetical protein JNL38_05780, partial [Myxococcales bacterium]|nr:hypothetical protein [Myxococcales bacterium]